MADVFQTRAGIHGCYRCPLIAPRHSNESYAGKQIDKNKQKFQIRKNIGNLLKLDTILIKKRKIINLLNFLNLPLPHRHRHHRHRQIDSLNPPQPNTKSRSGLWSTKNSNFYTF